MLGARGKALALDNRIAVCGSEQKENPNFA